MHFSIMVRFACLKCGESYNAFPPNETHRKVSKYPDRNTIPATIKCNICGNTIRIYWRSQE